MKDYLCDEMQSLKRELSQEREAADDRLLPDKNPISNSTIMLVEPHLSPLAIYRSFKILGHINYIIKACLLDINYFSPIIIIIYSSMTI